MLTFIVLSTLILFSAQPKIVRAEEPNPGHSANNHQGNGCPSGFVCSGASNSSGATAAVSVPSHGYGQGAQPGQPGEPGQSGQLAGPGQSSSTSPSSSYPGQLGNPRPRDCRFNPNLCVPYPQPAQPAQPGQPPQPVIDPYAVAITLLASIGVPDITPGVNPGLGMVHISSWFWLTNYNGQPLTASTTEDGVTVSVQLLPVSYSWDFGDGGSMDTSDIGEAYPAESSIQHTYERSSYSAGGSYPISITVDWAARYRVNGGPWLGLLDVQHTYTSRYIVQQAQPVLIGN